LSLPLGGFPTRDFLTPTNKKPTKPFGVVGKSFSSVAYPTTLFLSASATTGNPLWVQKVGIIADFSVSNLY
jgi:hypothetical protein